MNINIVVNLQYEATHCWPNCSIPEVDFLKHQHRHMFHIKIVRKVTHSDRDVEIIMFKRDMLNNLKNKYNGNFESNSCEQVAIYILSLDSNIVNVEVTEDGENGALVTR